MGKKKIQSQIMGKVNAVGFELRKRREPMYEIYLMVEVRLDRVDSVDEAQKRIDNLQKLIGSDVVLFVS